MKLYLLDTNVVSELRKQRPHGAVASWLGSLHEDQVFLSAVTMGELQAGIELTRVQNSGKAREIEIWAEGLFDSYQVIPMDASCFREWGRLMYRKSGHLVQDAMIAATARVHHLTVATRNEQDFSSFRVEIFNPFRQGRPEG